MKSILSHIRQSLSLKLSIGFLLLAIPIFMMSIGLLFMQSRNNIKHGAMEHANSVLNMTLQDVMTYLGTVKDATEANKWVIETHFEPDSLLSYSGRIVYMNAYVSGCSITAEPDYFPQCGKYFSAYTVRKADTIITEREAPYNYYEKTWYAKPRQLGKPCWVDPFNDYTEGTLSASGMIVSYCSPLHDATGRLIGIISADLSLKMLSDVINAEKPYPHSYIMMLGSDGHYYVHPDTTRLANQTIFGSEDQPQTAEMKALGHDMTTGLSGLAELDVDGIPSLVCYKPIPGTDWSLALVCPESDVLKSYNRLTNVAVILSLIGLLLIHFLCIRIVARSIRPIQRLLSQSSYIASGHYDDQIATTKRQDVIGRLQNSFALMQQSIKQHVDDIQQMNAQTEQRNNELVQANLLAEKAAEQKTAFIHNMTHQIRTPLNIILGMAQVLRDSIKDLPAEDVKSITDMMTYNTTTLNRMVLMLYDSSDTGLAEELKMAQDEVVMCNEVALECIRQTQKRFPDKTVDFHTSLPDDRSIHSNHLYFMRCLRELLYNAAKYSDGRHILLQASETPQTVRYVFEDTGPGIAEHYREQMFNPFTKVDDLSEGLGLGLPLTKRHVLTLGGTMTLDTSYKQGCRFILEFPKR